MAQKFVPLEDRVVVKPSDIADQTKEGIHIPEQARQKPVTGTVLSVGPGKMLQSGMRAKPSVKQGDLVVYGKFAGTEIAVGADALLVMCESELMGVLETVAEEPKPA